MEKGLTNALAELARCECVGELELCCHTMRASEYLIPTSGAAENKHAALMFPAQKR